MTGTASCAKAIDITSYYCSSAIRNLVNMEQCTDESPVPGTASPKGTLKQHTKSVHLGTMSVKIVGTLASKKSNLKRHIEAMLEKIKKYICGEKPFIFQNSG